MNRVANGVLALVVVFVVGTRAVAQPANDDCDSPLFVGQVQTPFNNIDATTDGPDEPNLCSFFDPGEIEADVWFRYAAECEGFVSISVCGSGYDTKLAVYRGAQCPTEESVACSDDDCGLSAFQSRVVVAVELGEQLGIRVGGFEGDQGEGILNIFCGQHDDFPACTDNAGECTELNSSRGCNELDCCRGVCELDPICCDVEWDAACVTIAAGVCGAGFETCGQPLPLGDFDGDGRSTIVDYGSFDACVTNSSPGSLNPGCSVFDYNFDNTMELSDFGGFQITFGAGDCLQGNGFPGCSSQSCCQAVCENDTYCCLVQWDRFCAGDAAGEVPCSCSDSESCPCNESAGECDISNGSPGCNDEACCSAVCAADSFCCADVWDDICVNQALDICVP